MRGLMGSFKFDHEQANGHIRVFAEDASDAFDGLWVAHVQRTHGRDRVWLYWRPADSNAEYNVAICSAPVETDEPISSQRVEEIVRDKVWPT